jgi:hypothetical protein
MLAAVRGPNTPHEMAAEASVVAGMAAIVARPTSSARPKMVAPKVVAILAAGVLCSAGAAAAATGSLPGPGPHALARVVSAIIDLPDSGKSPARTATTTTPIAVRAKALTSRTTGVAGPVSTANCPAGQNHGAIVSAVAHDHSLPGPNHGAAVSAVAQSPCGQPPGPAGDKPSPIPTTTSPTPIAPTPTTTTPGGPGSHGLGEGNGPPAKAALPPGNPRNGHGLGTGPPAKAELPLGNGHGHVSG